MQTLPKFRDLVHSIAKHDYRGRLLALDPGETTGASLVIVPPEPNQFLLESQLQITTWPLEAGVPNLSDVITKLKPTHVIYESYHVYSWRLNEHKFSEVPTLQIIGAIKTLCIQQQISYSSQSAQVGKAFFTDKRLKNLDCYFEGAPHARDSLRHALQFITFGSSHQKS